MMARAELAAWRTERAAAQSMQQSRPLIVAEGATSEVQLVLHYKSHGDADEFARQLALQDEGFATATAGDIRARIERFRIEGRPSEASAARGAAQMHRHHTVPREILKQLPEDVANNPLVRGRAGAPNRWSIPRDVHESIHRGPGGGAYNEAFKQRLGELGRNPTADDVLRIRDDLVKQFGLEGYRS
jgi:hypothetical protein